MRRLHESKLIDLAFDWNYIDGATPILQRWQDEMVNQKSDVLGVNRKTRKCERVVSICIIIVETGEARE